MSAAMDYPAAWAFVRGTNPADHHERCSWRTQNGALLCDCDVLWDEYVRRGGTDPRALRDSLEDLTVLGLCPHGVDLDREFCSQGCRV